MIIDHLIAYLVIVWFGLFIYSKWKRQKMKDTYEDIKEMLRDKEVDVE